MRELAASNGALRGFGSATEGKDLERENTLPKTAVADLSAHAGYGEGPNDSHRQGLRQPHTPHRFAVRSLGSPGRTRTYNLPVNNHLLYHRVTEESHRHCSQSGLRCCASIIALPLTPCAEPPPRPTRPSRARAPRSDRHPRCGPPSAPSPAFRCRCTRRGA
jgi:hypothetical protein